MGSWKRIELIKISNIISGYAFKSTEFIREGIKCIKITNVGVSKFVENDDECLPSDYIEKFERFTIFKDDVVISLTRPIINNGLKVSKVPENYDKALINQRVAGIQQIDGVSNIDFIYYYLQSSLVLKYVEEKSKSLNQPNLSVKDLGFLKIPLPPLPEQQRIVAKLDGLFAKIDQAISLLEANLQHTQALMGSVLDEEFGRLENYNIQTIDEIKESNVIGLVRSVKTQSYDKEFEYLKMNNITKNGSLDLSDLVTVDATKEEFEKFKLKKGDFLFNTRNSIELVGKTAVYDLNKPMIYNNNIMRLRFKDNIDPNFVNFQFFSNKTKADLEKIKSGTTNVAAIYYKTFKNLELKIPDIKVQNLLVIKLLDFSKKIELITESQTQKLNHLKALKSSLLDQAFKGEL